MPVYKNDLEDSPLVRVITCPSKDAPSMAVEFADGSHEIIDDQLILSFIDKYTNAKKHGVIKRTIGFHLEEKLRDEFEFLVKK